MKQLIVCPQGSQSPVLQEQITGIPKNSCICYSSSDKTVRFEMLWGYVLRNNEGKLKRTNQILLVSDLADVCISRIILKCLLMCATLPFFPHYNPFHIAVNSLSLLWVLTLLHIPYIFQIALQAPGHRALMDQILHNKIQPINTVFSSWKSCLVPQLLCWDRTLFTGHNADWMGTVIFRSLWPSGLTIPMPSVNMTASSSEFI